MKNETTRTKTQTGFSSRAIALVLCFVMLLTAIGSGSVLSAIAVAAEGSGAAELVDAAKAGADVNAPAPGEAEESSDILEPEDIDDGFVLTKKGDSDMVDTGRDADLAETGDTTYYVCYNLNNDGVPNKLTSSNQMKSIDGNYWGEIPSNGTQFFFGISDSSTFVGHSQLDSDRHATKDSNGVINQVGDQNYTYESTVYYYCLGHTTSAATVYVRWDGSNAVYLTTSKPAGYDDAGGGGGGGGGGGSDSGQTTGTAVNDADLIAVLLNQKIMFYYGVNWSTNNLWMYHGTFVSGTVSNTIDASTDSTSTINGVTSVAKGCAAIDSNTTYYITSNNTWAGNNVYNNYPTAGQLYYLESSSNNPNVKTSNVTITWDTDCDSDAITADTNSTIISATSSGKTGGNSDVSTKYYYTTDVSPTVSSTFKEFNPSDLGGGLAPGTYYIYAAAKDSNNVYIAASGPATLTVHPRLTTPVITLDTATDDNTSSQTASTTAKSTVTVTNVNSYNVGTVFTLYKGDTSIASNTTGVFSIARNTNTAGVYKVIASPGASDTTHSDSADSNTPTLSITKVAAPVTNPIITLDKNETIEDGKVVLTVTNAASFDPDIYDLYFYKVNDGSPTKEAPFEGIIGQALTTNPLINVAQAAAVTAGTNDHTHYYVVAEAKDKTVYTDSGCSNVENVWIQIPRYWFTGDLGNGSTWGTGSQEGKNKAADQYFGDNTFYHKYTELSGNKYFRIVSSNNEYGTDSTENDVAVGGYTSSSDMYDTVKGNTKAMTMSFDNTKSYYMFVHQRTDGASPQFYYRTDLSDITITKKYITYNLANDTFNSPATTANDNYVSVNTADSFVVVDGTDITVIATVTNSDYEFLGWYSSATISDANLITASPTLTVKDGVTSDTTYYPVVRQKVPAKYDVHVDKVDGVTVNATWNSRTASNGRYLSNVPAGATVTISGTAETGYNFSDVVVTSADGTAVETSGTKTGETISGLTFVMPSSEVTITAKAKSKYSLWYCKTSGGEDSDGFANPESAWSYASDVEVNRNSSTGVIYAKVPIKYFTGTNYTTLAFSDSSSELLDNMFYRHNSSYGTMSTTYGDSTSSTYINAKDGSWNTDNGTDKYYIYSAVKFKTDAALANAEYVLMEAYTNNNNYTFTLVSSDNPEKVSFIAKDGPARKDISGNSQENKQQTLGVVGSTWVTELNGGSEIGNQTTYATFKDNKTIKYYTGALTKGVTYTIHTTVSDTRFYVKAFNVNGVTVSILAKPASDPTAGAEYTCEYTVPNDAPSVLEITPIYFHYDDSNCVTFYLEGYDDVIQQELGWGDTPYIYPYYASLYNGDRGADNGHNAFGAYSGQPMITTGGVYYTQIPLTDIDLCEASGGTSETGTNIKGITISNGWYDPIHRDKEGWSASDDTQHLQTYDYDDFQKIFVEKNPTNIYYQMKLREDRDNSATYRHTLDTSLSSSEISDISSNGNGWELLRDKFNRVTDIFGKPLTNEQLNLTPLYVISTGYNANIAGSYGTSWQVYQNTSGSGYTLVTADGKSSIPPSLLFVNEAAGLANVVYPVNNHTNDYVSGYQIDPHNDSPSKYFDLYTALKTSYKEVPVYITYEKNDRTTKSNYGYTGSGQDTMYGPYRLDGRWFYTTAGDEINSNIEIQYIDGSGGYQVDTLTTGYKGLNNMGEHTGSKAYFTGEFDGKTESGKVILDGTKSFTMRAEAGDGYEFVGWYIKQDKSYVSMNPTNKTASTASSPRNGSSTYVARFKKLTSGSLSISNNNATGLAPDGNTYNGSGLGRVTVSYTFDGTNYTPVGEANSADTVTIGTGILNEDNLRTYRDNFKIKVVLGNTPDGEDSFALYHNKYTNRTSSADTPAPEFIINALDLFTVTTIEETTEYIQNTFSLLFDTYFNAHVYEYTISYNYIPTRLTSNTQTYTVEGSFDASVLSTNVDSEGKLKDSFIEKVRPTLSNFRTDMTYSATKTAGVKNDNTTTYTATVTYANAANTRVNVTLLFPYQVTNRAAGSFDFTPVLKDGKVVKDLSVGTILVQLSNGYEQYLTQNGTATDAVSGLLTAPASIMDGETPEFFQYWKVTDPAGEESFRVYNPMFNYRLFDNYRIEPIYDSVQVTNPNVLAAADQKDISISYLGTTRNQWNNSNNGGYTIAGNDDANTASDILFNDFELNYAYENRDVKTDSQITKLGVVIEKIGTVQYDTNGNPILDMSNYSAEDNSTNIMAFAETANDKATGTAGNNSVKNYTIAKNEVNNKNRVEFYYNTYNGYGTSGENTWKYTSTVKNNVYRAYTYMVVNGTVVLSSKPAFFTMYGEAV